jgi:hypothetical protein
VWIVEDIAQTLQLAGTLQLEHVLGYLAFSVPFTIAFTIACTIPGAIASNIRLRFPTTLVDILVFPLTWVTGTGFGFNIVPPLVFSTLSIRPDILTGDGTGMTPDTFIEVEHHRDL